MKQFSAIKSTKIEFQGKVVNAKIISVSSIFDFNTEKFFAQEMLKANTLIITKDSGKLSFVKQNDSEFWEEGFEYELDIKVGRIFRLFGKHFIKVIKIDHQNTTIITEERNDLCKVWNHSLVFKKLTDNQTEYTDQIVLYAGCLTNLLALMFVSSYKQRHRNWNKLLCKIYRV